jgi:hypothetical protein
VPAGSCCWRTAIRTRTAPAVKLLSAALGFSR